MKSIYVQTYLMDLKEKLEIIAVRLAQMDLLLIFVTPIKITQHVLKIAPVLLVVEISDPQIYKLSKFFLKFIFHFKIY